MKLRPFAGTIVPALFVFACSSTENGAAPGSSGGPGSGGASGQQVDGCKRSCDKMKFFHCSSAAEQARCYADCDKASPKQIEVFTGCAESSVCDPECRTSITPAQSGNAGGNTSGGGGGTSTGGGASPESCASACDKLVSCNFIKVGDKAACVSSCQKEAYQFQIDCVVGNACPDIPKACGATSGGAGGDDTQLKITRCQNACDTALFFKCITPAQQATCRDRCASGSASKRDAYTACAQAAGSTCATHTSCYSQLAQ